MDFAAGLTSIPFKILADSKAASASFYNSLRADSQLRSQVSLKASEFVLGSARDAAVVSESVRRNNMAARELILKERESEFKLNYDSLVSAPIAAYKSIVSSGVDQLKSGTVELNAVYDSQIARLQDDLAAEALSDNADTDKIKEIQDNINRLESDKQNRRQEIFKNYNESLERGDSLLQGIEGSLNELQNQVSNKIDSVSSEQPNRDSDLLPSYDGNQLAGPDASLFAGSVGAQGESGDTGPLGPVPNDNDERSAISNPEADIIQSVRTFTPEQSKVLSGALNSVRNRILSSDLTESQKKVQIAAVNRKDPALSNVRKLGLQTIGLSLNSTAIEENAQRYANTFGGDDPLLMMAIAQRQHQLAVIEDAKMQRDASADAMKQFSGLVSEANSIRNILSDDNLPAEEKEKIQPVLSGLLSSVNSEGSRLFGIEQSEAFDPGAKISTGQKVDTVPFIPTDIDKPIKSGAKSFFEENFGAITAEQTGTSARALSVTQDVYRAFGDQLNSLGVDFVGLADSFIDNRLGGLRLIGDALIPKREEGFRRDSEIRLTGRINSSLPDDQNERQEVIDSFLKSNPRLIDYFIEESKRIGVFSEGKSFKESGAAAKVNISDFNLAEHLSYGNRFADFYSKLIHSAIKESNESVQLQDSSRPSTSKKLTARFSTVNPN